MSRFLSMRGGHIKQGALLSYFALFVNVIIGLLYTPWLISSIGKSDYGLYTLAMSIIGLLAFDFGLGNATTKFVSQFLAEGRQDKVNNLLGLIYKLYLALDSLLLVSFIVIYFFLPKIYTGLTPEELENFSKVFIIASLYCVISFPFIPLNGTLTSYEQFVPLKACDLFHRVFIVITMSVCLLLGYGLYALIVINSVSGIITILLKLAIVNKKTPVRVDFRFWNLADLKLIFSFTIWITISALAQRLIFNIAPSILGIFSDSQAIALLGIAITLESYVYMFANAINGMFLPRVSRLLHDNAQSNILDLMIRVGRIQIFIIGFIFIWLAAFGKHFINVWVGESYSLVYYCVLLIIFPSLFHLPQEIGLTYIVAANQVKKQSYVYIIMGLLNIVLAIPLSKYYGVIGICFAIFIVYFIRTIGLDIIFYRVLHLNVFAFFKSSFLKLLPVFLVLVLFAFTIDYLILTSGWIGLIVKSVIYVVVFLGLLWFFGFNSYEKETFVYTPLKKLKIIK